ncbi:MAG: gamma-glutamyltransferase family protein [Pseudomonadota bacterium]
MRDFHLPGRSAVYAENGMCATSHPLAASVAIDTLKAGGNAADAAISAAVLLGICEPQMTGLGGDCFVLLSPAGSDEVVGLNGSGCAPAGLSAERLRADGHSAIPPQSADAVTLPGAVDAFCCLSETYGRLGLDRILAPAIDYHDTGVPVAPRVADDWAGSVDLLRGNARDKFLFDGKSPRSGQVFRSTGQAEVLRRIAAQGRDAFYSGEVAEDMLNLLQSEGGSHTAQDFAGVQADWTQPISGTFGEAEVLEHPPNGQGAAALLLMNILKHFDLAALDPYGAERAHIESEASKLAYDARNRFLADAGHTDRLDHLLQPATAAKLAALIDPGRVLPDPTAVTEAVHRETIYLTVVDRDRMAVSLIYSIFHNFGSGMASPKFGILMHNRGAGFTLAEGHPNEAGPGKRPMHTIIPGIVRRAGRVEMPFGVMGGQYQAAGHARFITNMEVYGMDPQAALDGPRCFSEAGDLRVERGYSTEVRQKLADLGHRVVDPPTAIGGGQAIRIHDDLGVLEGGSDPRKDGCALGY